MINAAVQSMVRVQAINSMLRIEEGLVDTDLVTNKIGVACKKGIDRGVVANALDRIFFNFSHEKGLSEDDIQGIVGLVVGRPFMVEGRYIMECQYRPLSDIVKCMGELERARSTKRSGREITRRPTFDATFQPITSRAGLIFPIL